MTSTNEETTMSFGGSSVTFVGTEITSMRVPAASVTAFQAKAALLDAGLLDKVEAMMSSPDTPRIVKLAWSEALTFERQSPTVLSMGASLNLDAATLDSLFAYASGVTA